MCKLYDSVLIKLVWIQAHISVHYINLKKLLANGGRPKAHFPPVTAFQVNNSNVKGGLISEGILTLVPLPKIDAKSLPWAKKLSKLFTVNSGKFKLSAQGGFQL